MKQDRRWFLMSLTALCACDKRGEATYFAQGAANLQVPRGFSVVNSDNPNGLAIASREAPLIEIRFVYQSLREQAKINPGVARTFLNGYAGTFGAERLSLGGSATGALIQAPASVGTPQEPAYESFGAVAFPDALVTFKLAARGPRGAEAILQFKGAGLVPLLSGLSAVGA